MDCCVPFIHGTLSDRPWTNPELEQSLDGKSILVMVRWTQDLYFGLNYTIDNSPAELRGVAGFSFA